MTRLIELLISIAIVAALFLLVALVLPSKRHLEQSVETNRKLTIVYDTLNSFRRFREWNALPLRDPKMDIKLAGPDSGVGARMEYASTVPQLGSGSWEITASTPGEKIAYKIDNPQRGSNKRSEMLLEPTGRNNRNVKITQTYDVDYGWNLLGRYAGLYVSRSVGDDMKLGLQRLTNMLASVPNVDYAVQGSKLTALKVVDRPAEDLLVVNAGSIDRENDVIKQSMKSNMEWINRAMAANGLKAAGPMRIVSTELGRETYTFDVVQPVTKDGATPGAPLEGLKLSSPVTYVRSQAGRAASASYIGYMAELENVRNALRAWAMTQGYEVTDRPYEAYKNGIDNAFTETGEYEVFWTLKQ